MAAAGAATVLCLAFLNAAGARAAGAHAAAVARLAASGGTWGKAEKVPGLAALNQGGFAQITSVSCGSAGNCAAVGFYSTASLHNQAFVVSEAKGAWGKAEAVPGLAALSQGRNATLESVSCGSAGNCAASGSYFPNRHSQQAFVVSEVKGTWGKAEAVPGLAALNQGRSAAIRSVSCGSAGNCSAGGIYTDGSGHGQAFVVHEVKGTWRKAEEVPGLAVLNQGGAAVVTSVSCASAGNCSAGGIYTDSSGNSQAFVVSEVTGTWRKAEEVPGLAALNQGGFAEVTSVSCARAGDCGAGGDYQGRVGTFFHSEAFVVSEVKGIWEKAEEVPGTAALNKGGDAHTTSVSCPSAGNCSAGGSYFNKPGHQQVFVVTEVKGAWETAQEIPGSGTLNQGGFADLFSASCGSAGNCGAGGSYFSTPVTVQAFVVSEVKGTWGKAEEVPGSGALNTAGFAIVNSVSCPPAGNCSAGGFYTYHAAGLRLESAFVVSETKG